MSSNQGLSYSDTQQLYKELEKLKTFIERDQEELKSLRQQLQREKLVKMLATAPQNLRNEISKRLKEIKLEVQKVVSNSNSNVTMPSKTRLIYFNGRGRAESIRLMLSYLNIKFEHIGISNKEELTNVRSRPSCVYGQVPILEMDDEFVVQSGAIVRYIGARFNLYPRRNDYKNIALVESIIEAVGDFGKEFGPFQFHRDVKKLKSELNFDRYLPVWENYLKAGNGRFVNGMTTIADLMVYAALESYVCACEELDKENFGKYPLLCQLYSDIDKQGRIQTYKKEERTNIVCSTEEYKKQLKAALDLNL